MRGVARVDVNPKADGPKIRDYYERIGMQPIDPRGQTEYGICSTSFLGLAFRTDSCELTWDFNEAQPWSYVSDTMLAVKGQSEPFLHRDRNQLVKVTERDLNPRCEDCPRRQLDGAALSSGARRRPSALKATDAFQIGAIEGLGQPQSAARSARPADDRLAPDIVRQDEFDLLADLKMALVDETGAALRQIDEFNTVLPLVGNDLRLRVHGQPRLAIAACPLFSGKLLQHVRDVDLLVEGNAAAATFRPYHLATHRDSIRQRDFKHFADRDRHIGGQHHTAIGHVPNAPQANVTIALDLRDAPHGAIAVRPTPIAARLG